MTDKLKQLVNAGADFVANSNIAEHLAGPGELDAIQANTELAAESLLDALLIDWRNDHNAKETPKRFAKMLVRELFAGRYTPKPDVTDFPNVLKVDQLYVVGPITVNSTCSHHLVPILGKCWFGVIPSERVVGLSKFSRLASWIFSRPQIQEEATMQLADLIEQQLKPVGLAVVVQAEHMCMHLRGVKEPCTSMTTSEMRGLLRDDPKARAEFLTLAKV